MMANLRGGSIDKQIKDAWHRLERYGEGRHGRDDHGTHSVETGKKREMYLRDFARYVEREGISGKLNQAMGDREVMERFLKDRIEDLGRKSAVDYVAGWSSMVQGLREANVTVAKGADKAIEAVREAAKEIPKAEVRVGRAVAAPDAVVAKLGEIRPGSGLVAQIQRETGFRTSEAYKLAREPEKYLRGETVQGMIGKGNHVYDPKPVSPELAEALRSRDFDLPKPETYAKDLREATGDPAARPHDWRYTYARERMEAKLAGGTSYEQALREVSRELNHHRGDMTEYYLARA